MFFIVCVNLLISNGIRADKRNYLKFIAAASREEKAQPLKHKNPLKPADPKDYGMLVVPNADLPRSQFHSDVFVGKIIKESGVLEEGKVVSELKKMNISPEEFEDRTQYLDERIAVYKARKESDPSDLEAEEKLHDLYLLKSVQASLLQKALEQKPVSSAGVSDTQSQPAEPQPQPAAVNSAP